MSFADFVLNSDETQKMRKKVEETIIDAVKKNIIDTKETEDCTIIRCTIPGRRRDSELEICVLVDFMKKVYRGNYQVIYINVVKQSSTTRESDSIVIDTSRVSESDFATTLLSIKDYFTKLLNNPLVQDSKK